MYAACITDHARRPRARRARRSRRLGRIREIERDDAGARARLPASTPDFHYINDDRKVRPGGRVQLVLHAPRAGSRRRARATGRFLLGVGRCWTPRKNLPEGSRRCEDPAPTCAACPPRAPMGIPRARISPCRVLHTNDWEGEQGLRELTLEDALQHVLVCADLERQRPAAMGDPCRRDHGLSGDVR